MELITNVKPGKSALHPIVLSTSGISSCIGVIVGLENSVFVFHADPSQFYADTSCRTINAHDFLMNIFDRFCQSNTMAVVKHIYLIGGWNDNNYLQLQKEINVIRENSKLVLKDNHVLPLHNFDAFVSLIYLNLIGFNVSSKTLEGKNKEEDDDDSPDDYVFDTTILYDRSSIPSTLVMWQYGGCEDEMMSHRSNSLLLAMYLVDTMSHVIRAYIYPNAYNTRYYSEFAAQVALNVTDPSYVHQSLTDHVLEEKLANLLSRIKRTSI